MSAEVIDLNERRVLRAYNLAVALMEDMLQDNPPLLKKIMERAEEDDKEWMRPSDSECPFQ